MMRRPKKPEPPNRYGPKGPRPGSQASYYRELLLEGRTNDETWLAVKRRYPEARRNLAAWYRWQLRSRPDLVNR
jgi:hypothetical protein